MPPPKKKSNKAKKRNEKAKFTIKTKRHCVVIGKIITLH